MKNEIIFFYKMNIYHFDSQYLIDNFQLQENFIYEERIMKEKKKEERERIIKGERERIIKGERNKPKKKTFLPLKEGSCLPHDHTIKRGRGRVRQLIEMTEREKQEENQAIMEKNKLAARESRKRKKLKEESIDKKIIFYKKEIKKLKLENYDLKQMLKMEIQEAKP